ncbi:MAG: hypothetical protein IPF96_10560 [Rhodobacter sp.]|nr:hypothetical protein [Rhodobacter sp.]
MTQVMDVVFALDVMRRRRAAVSMLRDLGQHVGPVEKAGPVDDIEVQRRALFRRLLWLTVPTTATVASDTWSGPGFRPACPAAHLATSAGQDTATMMCP